MKESVIFINDSRPYTFMNGDDEYGHAVIKTPYNLRKRMSITWFETDFCRYINNETYYDKNRNVIKETWYYRSGKIVDDYVYTFDHLNRLIGEITKNEYSERRFKYWYEGNSKTVTFREYYYKRRDKPAKNTYIRLETMCPLLLRNLIPLPGRIVFL